MLRSEKIGVVWLTPGLIVRAVGFTSYGSSVRVVFPSDWKY